MRRNEPVTHYQCPSHVAEDLKLAGGLNRFGEPNFRIVWGWDRMVPMTGEWQEWEQLRGKLTDRSTGISQTKDFIKLVRSVVETRTVPKYLPANCWHLEKWCPPEDYGTPEAWGKLGEEVVQGMTVDTAGPFPARGEYELCYPLTDDLTVRGQPIGTSELNLSLLVGAIRAGKERLSYAQRRAAIMQREARKEEGFIRRVESILRDEMRPFAGEDFVVVPGKHSNAEVKRIIKP